jgi:hypothetical protein
MQVCNNDDTVKIKNMERLVRDRTVSRRQQE